MAKVRQLSIFKGQVEQNPICRCFLNPKRHLLKTLRLEGIYKVENPHLRLDQIMRWNIMRHVNGVNPEKIGRRVFYNQTINKINNEINTAII